MAAARSHANGASTEQIAKQFAQIQKDVAQLGEAIARLAADKGEEMQKGVRQAFTDTFAAGEEAGREALRGAEQEVQRLVTERPLTSIAVAAGVGYLIGLMSNRK